MFWIRLVELTQRGIQIAHRRILHSIAPALCQMADWHSVEYVTNDQHPDETMQPCITARSPPSGTDDRPAFTEANEGNEDGGPRTEGGGRTSVPDGGDRAVIQGCIVSSGC